MTIPATVERVTVRTGEPMTTPNGTPIRGRFYFTAPDINIITSDDFIFGGTVIVELVGGAFSVDLVPQDATGINPTGWSYTVRSEFYNAPNWIRSIQLTKDEPDVILSDILSPGPLDPEFTFGFLPLTGGTMTGDIILPQDPNQPLEAATKQYVDAAQAAAESNLLSESVSITGDTMTGPLILAQDPVQSLEASTKQYVDTAQAEAESNAMAESVSVTGDTMTGPLVLSGNPSASLGAATKQYVDAAQAAAQSNAMTESVSVTGDTMTGPLVLSVDPSLPLGAATKQYVDTAESNAMSESVSITGDTMTGSLILSGNPSASLGAATKQYVDTAQAAAQSNAMSESVSITGDTMTGSLILSGNPTAPLGAATKQYVDTAQAAAQSNAMSESVSITGDTMTGSLVLSANPTAPLGAATKQYVDTAQATAESNAMAESVSITGDTMTGELRITMGSKDIRVSEATSAALSTGVLTGGEINVNGSNPQAIDISAVVAYVVDTTTNPSNPVVLRIQAAARTVSLDAPALLRSITWWLMDSSGNIVQQATRPTPVQRRSHVVLGLTVYNTVSGSIIIDQTLPTILAQPENQLADLMDALGPFRMSGLVVSPNGVNLSINHSAGTMFSRAFNYFDGPVMTRNPHTLDIPSGTAVPFRRVLRTPQVGTPPTFTTLDPANYDLNGVLTAVGGGSNVATIQRVWIFGALDSSVGTNHAMAVQYGQTTYANLTAANNAIGSGTFVPNSISEDGALLAYVTMIRTCTDISDPLQATITFAGKFATP